MQFKDKRILFTTAMKNACYLYFQSSRGRFDAYQISVLGTIYPGLLFLLLSIVSCVDPILIHINATDSKPLLVVEGQITDEVGPFRVKLTNSGPADMLYPPKPVLNADVLIVDNKGNSFRLYGDSNGLYETPDKNLKGVPGNTYTLYITAADDSKQYTSSPVLMQEAPEIDSLYFEEVTHPRFSQGFTYEDNWLNVLLDSHDAESKNKYWRYEFEETFEVNLAADRVKIHHDPNSTQNFDWQSIQIDDKKICWVTNPSATIVLNSTIKNPVDEIKRFQVQSIGPGDARLHVRYSILVKQYSIDVDLYNYLKLLKDVNENSGGIYNKIPAPVFGNITCSDGTTKALGYFSATSVRKKRLFINRSEHHVETINMNEGCVYWNGPAYNRPPERQKIYFGYYLSPYGIKVEVYTSSPDCADCALYGTHVKPSFWQ